MSFPRYAAYKDSGVEWLGEVPEHWDITKVKHVFKIGRGRVIAQDILQENGLYPVFSSQTKDNGCLGYIDTYDFDCDQITWTTDGANAGTVFIRGGKHNCTNVCGTLELKTLTNNLFYYGYYLQFATQFYKRPDTNGAKIMNNEMADILLFKISISEQTTIAAFLDCETAKIDNLINEQKKLIELLKEKRQAVISTAVTKGLNPHAPMKDSGVEWLGEVPMGWEVIAIKRICDVRDGTHDTPLFVELAENTYPLITSKDLNSLNICFDEAKQISESDYIEISKRSAKSAGDIIFMPMIGKYWRCSPLVRSETVLSINNYIALFKHALKFQVKWLLYILNSDLSTIQFTIQRSFMLISTWNIENMPIAVPPPQEQTTIVAFLDQETAKIDNLIQQAQKATTLLQERRTALISAAVTGKIDVRNKSLPASL